MKKIIFLLFFIFYFLFNSVAQQQVEFTQYFINDMIYNPAISGSKSYNTFFIQTRRQWLGFEGAPFSTNIGYHGAVNNRSAMGAYLMYDATGPAMQANMHLHYAYHVPLNAEKLNLSFGLGSKFMYYNLDFDPNDLPEGIDPAFSSSAYEKTLGDIESGIYLYSKDFYIGYSVINMLQSSFNNEEGDGFSINNQFRNYYGIIGYRSRIINNDWELEPSLLIRHEENQPRLYNISTRILYLKNTWLGISYKTNKNMAFLFGFLANDKMHVAYSYDYTLSGGIMKYNYGTHELSLSFRIPTLSSQRHIGFWQY